MKVDDGPIYPFRANLGLTESVKDTRQVGCRGSRSVPRAAVEIRVTFRDCLQLFVLWMDAFSSPCLFVYSGTGSNGFLKRCCVHEKEESWPGRLGGLLAGKTCVLFFLGLAWAYCHLPVFSPFLLSFFSFSSSFFFSFFFFLALVSFSLSFFAFFFTSPVPSQLQLSSPPSLH